MPSSLKITLRFIFVDCLETKPCYLGNGLIHKVKIWLQEKIYKAPYENHSLLCALSKFPHRKVRLIHRQVSSSVDAVCQGLAYELEFQKMEVFFDERMHYFVGFRQDYLNKTPIEESKTDHALV